MYTDQQILAYHKAHPISDADMKDFLYGDNFALVVKALHAAEDCFLRWHRATGGSSYPTFSLTQFIRATFGLGLAESKDFVENYRRAT